MKLRCTATETNYINLRLRYDQNSFAYYLFSFCICDFYCVFFDSNMSYGTKLMFIGYQMKLMFSVMFHIHPEI